MSPRVALLAGGVGGAKLADGLRRALGPGELAVVANIGDDFELHGLAICPDHDTLLYTLAGLGDRERGWGLAGETWNALDQFAKIGAPHWFRLGDRDLALHVHRTALLRSGARLTDVNRALQRQLGLVDAPILPASDAPLRTHVRTDDGWSDFQSWFVGAQAKPEVREVRFEGRADATDEVRAALGTAEQIFVAPSNPLVSIAPILAVRGIREAIAAARARGVRVVGVSPIVGGAALKGPADRMLGAAGFDVSPAGVAASLTGLMDALVIEAGDRSDELEAAAAPHVGRLVDGEIVMRSDADRLRLARSLLAL